MTSFNAVSPLSGAFGALCPVIATAFSGHPHIYRTSCFGVLVITKTYLYNFDPFKPHF